MGAVQTHNYRVLTSSRTPRELLRKLPARRRHIIEWLKNDPHAMTCLTLLIRAMCRANCPPSSQSRLTTAAARSSLRKSPEIVGIVLTLLKTKFWAWQVRLYCHVHAHSCMCECSNSHTFYANSSVQYMYSNHKGFWFRRIVWTLILLLYLAVSRFPYAHAYLPGTFPAPWPKQKAGNSPGISA